MKTMETYISKVCDEANDAMHYAEQYLINKNRNPQWAKMYMDMANQELLHANYLKSIGDDMIAAAAWVPEDDLDRWDNCVAKMAEKEAMVRVMLSK